MPDRQAVLRGRMVTAMEHANLSPEDLAAASGWSVHRIRGVRAGMLTATALDVALVSWATGADPAWLVEGTDIPEGMVRQGVRAMPGGVCLRRHLPDDHAVQARRDLGR